MKAGADVELQDTWFGGRALVWGAFMGHYEVCKQLVETYGANISSVNWHGQVALEIISEPDRDTKWTSLLKKQKGKKNIPITSPITTETPNPKKNTQNKTT